MNILTDQLSDFDVVDLAVRKFEAVSGAILSRDKKCKVIAFGSWRNREEWPIHYLKTVKELKVFGIYVMDSYRSLIKRNWDFRFGSQWGMWGFGLGSYCVIWFLT